MNFIFIDSLCFKSHLNSFLLFLLNSLKIHHFKWIFDYSKNISLSNTPNTSTYSNLSSLYTPLQLTKFLRYDQRYYQKSVIYKT